MTADFTFLQESKKTFSSCVKTLIVAYSQEAIFLVMCDPSVNEL